MEKTECTKEKEDMLNGVSGWNRHCHGFSLVVKIPQGRKKGEMKRQKEMSTLIVAGFSIVYSTYVYFNNLMNIHK